MLTGVLMPSGGEVRVCGLVPVPQRRRLAARIGVVFGQRSQLWWDLPLRDSFELARHVWRVPAADHAARLARFRRDLRPGRLPRHPGPPALAGPADARRADHRAAARARGALPGRADDRAGRGEPAGGAVVPHRAARPRATPRSCSPPTTWPTSSGSAGDWSSSTTAGSCTTARWPRCTTRYGSRRRVLVELDEPLAAPVVLPGVVQETVVGRGATGHFQPGRLGDDGRRAGGPPGRGRLAARHLRAGTRDRGRHRPPVRLRRPSIAVDGSADRPMRRA